MHPPLDRPHPDCQEEIENLRHCHATESKLKFWACNEVKARLDKCFKAEKLRMLAEMNKHLDEGRTEEQAHLAIAFGKKETFQEFLQKDVTFQKEVEREREKQKSWFSF
jgi:COX assembly protein 2